MNRQDLAWERTGPTATLVEADGVYTVEAGTADAVLFEVLRAAVARPIRRVVPIAGSLDGEWITAPPRSVDWDLVVDGLRAHGWYAVAA